MAWEQGRQPVKLLIDHVTSKAAPPEASGASDFLRLEEQWWAEAARGVTGLQCGFPAVWSLFSKLPE